jgi:hypothetical protein
MLCCESNSQSGWTALINAGYMGRADCVRLLIDAGADKDARNNVRRRCLICLSLFLFAHHYLQFPHFEWYLALLINSWFSSSFFFHFDLTFSFLSEQYSIFYFVNWRFVCASANSTRRSEVRR